MEPPKRGSVENAVRVPQLDYENTKVTTSESSSCRGDKHLEISPQHLERWLSSTRTSWIMSDVHGGCSTSKQPSLATYRLGEGKVIRELVRGSGLAS